MDYTSTRASPAFLEIRPSPSSHCHAGRVFLLEENTRSGSPPNLYQLKDHTLNTLLDKNNKFISLKGEDFIPLGEVASVDRERKIIYLKDGSIATYEHLILAAKTDPNVLSSSICALKIQYKSNEIKHEKKNLYSQKKLNDRTRIESDPKKFKTLRVNDEDPTKIAATLNGYECHYELHF